MLERVDALGRRLSALVARLHASGFVFDRPDAVFPGPQPAAAAAIARIEAEAGPLPRALVLFWTCVGSVDLSGAHPDWPEPSGYLDPLIVYPPDVSLYELDDPRADGFEAVIAPDYFHKADVSGGAPYSVSVPALADDPPMNGTPDPQSFLEHVENALRFGGFPGLADCPDHAWPLHTLTDDPSA